MCCWAILAFPRYFQWIDGSAKSFHVSLTPYTFLSAYAYVWTLGHVSYLRTFGGAEGLTADLTAPQASPCIGDLVT